MTGTVGVDLDDDGTPYVDESIPPAPGPSWLDEQVAGEVIGADLLSGVDTPSFTVHVDAARTFVEERRPDLWVLVDDVATFTPPRHVVVASAMLAYRTYQQRTAPADEIGNSDDLRAMLKIGKTRGLRFGGAAGVPVVVEAV